MQLFGTIHVNDIAVILYADVGLSFALQTSVRYLIRGTVMRRDSLT